MSFDGTVKDFDTEAEARALFAQKKLAASKAKIEVDIGGIERHPFAHIHKCYHDETPPRPCEIIEEYRKK